MEIRVRGYGKSYKAKLIKNAFEIIDNCNCWLEDENLEYTSSEEREWFEFEKETIQGLLELLGDEE